MTTTRSNRHTAVSAFLAIPALLFALTACSPTASGGADASGAGASNDAGAGQPSLMDWQLDYAECMRGEGIDMPDPEQGGNGSSTTLELNSEDDMAALEAASEKCRSELGEPPAPSEEEEAAAEKQFLDWATNAAECYRENGYEMPDPKAGERPQFPADAPEELQQECGGAGAVSRTE